MLAAAMIILLSSILLLLEGTWKASLSLSFLRDRQESFLLLLMAFLGRFGILSVLEGHNFVAIKMQINLNIHLGHYE